VRGSAESSCRSWLCPGRQLAQFFDARRAARVSLTRGNVGRVKSTTLSHPTHDASPAAILLLGIEPAARLACRSTLKKYSAAMINATTEYHLQRLFLS